MIFIRDLYGLRLSLYDRAALLVGRAWGVMSPAQRMVLAGYLVQVARGDAPWGLVRRDAERAVALAGGQWN